MKYIINLTIVFDPGDRELMLKNNSQLSTGLSKPATRLLSELIHNNNIDLSRETLLKRVWEDYGFSPSNASLNNHISELRRAFESLGAGKGIIITLPRLGFRLEAEIHPETKELREVTVPVAQTENNPPKEDDSAQAQDTQCIESEEKTEKYNKNKVIILITGLLIATVLAVVAFVHLANGDEIPQNTLQGKCKIYSFHDEKPPFDFADKAREMIAREGIDCSREETDIYYSEARPTNERLRVYFMAVCAKNDATSYKNCINYKLVE